MPANGHTDGHCNAGIAAQAPQREYLPNGGHRSIGTATHEHHRKTSARE
jgi:hypothetical protein